MSKAKMDEEMKIFAADVLESIAQAKRGKFARVRRQSDIATYKARGHHVGVREPLRDTPTGNRRNRVVGAYALRARQSHTGFRQWNSALQQLGRNGVPVYVMYKSGSAPVVLSEILSVDEVRGVIARL